MIDSTIVMFRDAPDMSFILDDHITYIVRPSGAEHGFDLWSRLVDDLIDGHFHSKLSVYETSQKPEMLILAMERVNDHHVFLRGVEGYPVSAAPMMYVLTGQCHILDYCSFGTATGNFLKIERSSANNASSPPLHLAGIETSWKNEFHKAGPSTVP